MQSHAMLCDTKRIFTNSIDWHSKKKCTWNFFCRFHSKNFMDLNVWNFTYINWQVHISPVKKKPHPDFFLSLVDELTIPYEFDTWTRGENRFTMKIHLMRFLWCFLSFFLLFFLHHLLLFFAIVVSFYFSFARNNNKYVYIALYMYNSIQWWWWWCIHYNTLFIYKITLLA